EPGRSRALGPDRGRGARQALPQPRHRPPGRAAAHADPQGARRRGPAAVRPAGREQARPADPGPDHGHPARPRRRDPWRDPDDGGGRRLTPTARLVTALNGRITSVSTGTGELLAIDDRWLSGKPLAAFVVDEERRGFRALLLDLGRGNGPIGTSLRLQR